MTKKTYTKPIIIKRERLDKITATLKPLPVSSGVLPV